MERTRKLLTAGIVVAAAAVGGAGAAIAGAGGEDASERTTGPGADRATKAALAVTRGGTANSVERDSENGAVWEVEVTKPDGTTVDVRLDGRYELVVVESDSDSGSESAAE